MPSANAKPQQQSHVRLVHNADVPTPFRRRLEQVIEDAPRPFRLYDEVKRKWLMYRAYVHKGHAMKAALWVTKWLPIGTTIAVVDVRTAKLHAQYTRRVNHVEFHNESLKTIPKEHS